MKFELDFFTKELLQKQSLNFRKYKDYNEVDILLEYLNFEIITDYSEVSWNHFSECFINESEPDVNGRVYFTTVDRLENFIEQILPREVRVKLLVYFRDCCTQTLLSYRNYDKGSIAMFQRECARLINVNIEESRYDEYHGDFANYPRPNFEQLVIEFTKNPTGKGDGPVSIFNKYEQMVLSKNRNTASTPISTQPASVSKIDTTQKKKSTFRDIIQNVAPDKLLIVLHQQIDGHGGKDVAYVLGAAYYKYHYIKRYPTEPEFVAEFPNTTTKYRAIKNQLKEPLPNGKDAFSIGFQAVELIVPT